MPEEPPVVEKPVKISDNPHKLWRQIVGFVFWVGGIELFRWVGLSMNPHNSEIRKIFLLVVMGLPACLMFTDAWVSGIYKDRSRKSFINISPMSWGIGMSAIFFITYPVYVLKRNKLRTRNGGNGFFIATIILGGGQTAWLVTDSVRSLIRVISSH